MTTTERNRTADLLTRAEMFRLLGCAFATPSHGRAAGLREAFAELSARYGKATDLLSRRLRSAERAWRAADDDSIDKDYLRLFSPAGPVPLYESGYCNARLAGRALKLADIDGFYHAFGFQYTHGSAELSDHAYTELQFLSWLLAKEAFAHRLGLSAQAQLAGEAVRVFLQRHAGRWMGVFARQIGQHGADTPYCELGALLQVVMDREYRRRRVRPPPGPARRKLHKLKNQAAKTLV